MANEKLGVATEPSPESLWGSCTFVEWGVGLYTGRLYICAVGLDILKLE